MPLWDSWDAKKVKDQLAEIEDETGVDLLAIDVSAHRPLESRILLTVDTPDKED